MDHIKKKKVLAVASAGGHWTQLLRLTPAFDECDLMFASTNKSNYVEVEDYPYYSFKDATRRNPWNLVIMFFQVIGIVLKTRPDLIITTGAAPGLLMLIVGKFFGKKTIWIDSIANVEVLSTSGKYAKRFASLYLTQWEELVKNDEKLSYLGAVI